MFLILTIFLYIQVQANQSRVLDMQLGVQGGVPCSSCRQVLDAADAIDCLFRVVPFRVISKWSFKMRNIFEW